MSEAREPTEKHLETDTVHMRSFGLGQRAGLIAIGNIAGRVLGLVREIVIATYFGATGQVSAFRIASQVPTMIYDLLAGGMLSAALVPTLSEYATSELRSTFIQLIGTLLTLFAAIMALLVIVLEIGAPRIGQLLAPGFQAENPALLDLTIQLLRIVLPTVWFVSMAGIVMGILYAQERFGAPSMAAAVFNLGIVIATPLFARSLGIQSLALGMLVGSAAQFTLMGWDLARFLYQENLHLPLLRLRRHPALLKIVRLYLPVAVVTLLSTGQIALDRRLATTTGEQSIAWMQYATTLQQLPLGLISVAIALASLPKLSVYFAEQNILAYKETLAAGLRLVMLLIAPAAIVLWQLGEPIIRLIFEHREFLPEDTVQVYAALRIYTLGMLFAAIDFLLNYAFYARHNTLLPAVAGFTSIFVYVITAFALLESMGYLGLVWADTVKHASHLLFMGIALRWQMGRLQSQVGRYAGKIAIAALCMLLGMWVMHPMVHSPVSNAELDPYATLFSIGVIGGGGLLVYALGLHGLGVSEVRWLLSALAQKLR